MLKPNSKVLGSLFRIALSVAALCFIGALFYRLGPEKVFSLFGQVGWKFAGVVVIYGIEEMVRASALLQCFHGDSRPQFRELARISLLSEAARSITLTGPLVSEPTRAWLIRRQGVPSAQAVAATVTEYVANSLVSAVLTIGAVVYLSRRVGWAGPLRVWGTILLYGSTAYLVVGLVILFRRARKADRLSSMARVTLLEVVAESLLLVETYWALTSMGLTTTFIGASLAEILTKVANVTFAGATEGGYAFLFSALGLPAAAGFTLALIKRLRSVAFALTGLGIFAVIDWSARWPGREFQAASLE
jgi:hypothetical protein